MRTPARPQPRQTLFQVDQMLRPDHQLDVPAELVHAAGIEFEVGRIESARMRQDEAHAARALLVERRQLGVGNIARGHDHGPHG